MTTEQATDALGTIWATDCGQRLYDTTRGACARILLVARRAGQEWDWDAAEDALARAYRLLGAEPPIEGGEAWHAGRHPIQIAAQAWLATVDPRG
jgi:hypothetical protein